MEGIETLPAADPRPHSEGRFRPYPDYRVAQVDRLDVIPEHWDLRTFRHAARLQYGASLPSSDRLDGEVPVFGSNGPVGSHDQAITLSPVIIVGRKGSAGQVNYSTVRTYPIDTTYFVDGRSSREHLRWLYYVLSSLRLDELSEHSAVPGLSREYVYGLPVAVPPRREQEAIAAFLDRETGKIDDLITMKERLIELLDEKRTALITQAVTKGLDPDAPMKESGVEWLGKIPEDWDVTMLKRVVAEFFDFRGRTPQKLNMDWGGDIPAISARNVRDGYLDLEEGVNYGSQQLYNRWMTSGDVRQGDILFTTEAPLGNVALVPDSRPYILSQRVILLRTDCDAVHNPFLFYQLRSSLCQQRLQRDATGSTAEGISQGKLAMLSVCVPPLPTQQAIGSFLSETERGLNEVIDRVRVAIMRLREYRSALITAAVTGKIDVRKQAA